MKALTLHQSWDSLVASGVKTVEPRPWATSYRSPAAIHNAVAFLPSPTAAELSGWVAAGHVLVAGRGVTPFGARVREVDR